MLCDISVKGKSAPEDKGLSQLSNSFFLAYVTLQVHPHPFMKRSVLSLHQENEERVGTKTIVPILSNSLSNSGRPPLFASPHTTFDYSKRRAFVVSGGRSCSHGNVLGVRWRLLDTYRENRRRAHHCGCLTKTDHEIRSV